MDQQNYDDAREYFLQAYEMKKAFHENSAYFFTSHPNVLDTPHPK